MTPHSNPTSSSSVGSTHTHVSTVPRAQMTAVIEQSVPSVLDSAAELLTSLQDASRPEGDRIEVKAPVPFGNHRPFSMSGYSSPSSGVTGFSGFSPIIRGRGSRSPSPGPSAGVNTNKIGGSLLLSGGGSTSGSKPAPKISTSTLTSPTGTTSTSSSPNMGLLQSTTSQGRGFAHGVNV
ncbi:hypothetical protein VKT23_010033 [Stygiomarasmius scandens]|uniref:Mixed-lineage leukemia-like protein n=1 Tax=Marasmiellus scandens TaxID=2682957 RepID=A0ABR1JCV0_9AGAR